MRIKNILQYLERAAAQWPDRICFTDGVRGESLTFSALLSLSQCVGSSLLHRGIGAGDRVAILMDRHPAILAAMFGVIYSGASYVVLDPDAPPARWKLLGDTVSARCWIWDDDHGQLAESLWTVSDGSTSGNIQRLLWDELLMNPPDEKSLRAVRERQIDMDPVYTVFTSGSTGEPKGVIANHRSVIDYAEALGEALPFDSDTVFGCQSPLFFDAPLKEILSTLRVGARTCLIPRNLFSFPVLLMQYLEENQVNTICWVSSALSALAVLGVPEELPPKTLRTVIFGSERLPTSHYLRWRKALPTADFWQLYGPTEATGMSCVWHADREIRQDEPLPIGHALDNTEVILLDESGQRLTAADDSGKAGEIYLRGSCVTMGYDHNRERTAAVFVQNPLQDAYPETVYRTGDLAYYNEYGELVYRGRIDAQIKRMGYRIEPGEMEQCAQRMPGVDLCVCVTDSRYNRIGLFYTGKSDPDQVECWLRERLPQYMLPTVIRKLAQMPRMANGKFDRRCLTESIEN